MKLKQPLERTFYLVSAAEISPNLRPLDGFLFIARDEADGSVWLYKTEPNMEADGRWTIGPGQDVSEAAVLLPFDVPTIEARRLYYIAFEDKAEADVVDRYDIAQGMIWSDGWRWIARDGNGEVYLFESQPEAIGEGKDLRWISGGRSSRMPFISPRVPKRSCRMISFQVDMTAKERSE